jgi:hypothetical protein
MREMMKNRPASYEPRDIFHVDEIGLFYMLLPERSFVAPEVAHKLSKKNKDCTTLLLACFFWGEKLTPVVIDKSRSPRALRNTHIDNLPCKYEWHSRAWMTYDIFQNFLNTTNESMKSRGRKICIVPDNFSGDLCIANPQIPNQFITSRNYKLFATTRCGSYSIN